MTKQFKQHGYKILYENKTGLLDLPPPWVLWEQATTTGIDPKVVVRAVFPLLTLMGIILVCFLISHVRYIAAGYTTLEQSVALSMMLAGKTGRLNSTSHEDRDAFAKLHSDIAAPMNPFNQGFRANLIQILGPIHLLFLPVPVAPPLPFVPKLKVS
eukprot:CAMPEP_0113591088 /NCGR_PEP_ID=MMETSP0015_2-20120614/37054_1 /TAXON_ID=2838 /ORGANISM="Odontella" /LENGTH=155 /DNA_ID=CAMNT_0000497389 /DNA_START=838 /DNA_END=1305 /DNA_ORIENTATION=+ /assembly_acc=CAM_ASM_000160